MAWKTSLKAGTLTFIGYMLSPLSWWNDMFLNIPLAVGFAWVVSRFYAPAYEFAVVFGYWLTNVLGLYLMHRGIQNLRGQEQLKLRHNLHRDLLISLAYTALIVVLLKLGLLQPLTDLAPRR
jgi:hypothetical protein